jgi:hypothetical protein
MVSQEVPDQVLGITWSAITSQKARLSLASWWFLEDFSMLFLKEKLADLGISYKPSQPF